MRRYGTDKPDLRFGLEIEDVSDLFAAAEFRLFRQAVERDGVVRALCAPQLTQQPRSFFDNLRKYIEDEGGKGLAYLLYGQKETQGPIAAALGKELISQLGQRCNAAPGSALFFIADTAPKAAHLAGKLRLHLADQLNLRQQNVYRFCWIVDFPLYEWSEDHHRLEFSHNPFSMPQGGMAALETQPPLEILAHQYDIVCNGLEPRRHDLTAISEK
tara:strand:- start:76 stop:720 length:645 start_codon:yes stop_codon:yes gene_type:complete